MKSKLYEIRDNGIRSFVPPCFNWELTDSESRHVDKVSMLDLSDVADTPTERESLQVELAKGEIAVTGHISQTDESAHTQGHVVFKVESVLPKTNKPRQIY